jgi:hypothetical protein
MVLDLVKALEGEAGELDLTHRLETVERHPDRRPDDAGFRERTVDDPPAAEAPVEILRHAKDAAVDAHVLADDHDVRIPLHLLEESQVQRLDHVELRHGSTRQSRAGPVPITVSTGWSFSWPRMGGEVEPAPRHPRSLRRAATSARSAATCGGSSAYA